MKGLYLSILIIMFSLSTTVSFLRKSYPTKVIVRRYLNRLLLEANELKENQKDHTFTAFLPESDSRCQHIKQVLKMQPGDSIRSGVVNVGLTDTTTIVSNENGVTIAGNINDFRFIDRPNIDIILALPRPLRLEKILPAIACLGVHRIILVGANKVEKDYFGSHLLRNAVERRKLLMEGLSQSATDYHLPDITVYKSLSLLFQKEISYDQLDETTLSRNYRMIAHPPYALQNTSSLRFHQLLTSSTIPLHIPISTKPSSLTIPVQIKKESISNLTIAIGPEGGWIDSEVALFQSKGFQLVNTGERILRTDIAITTLLGMANEFLASNR